MQYQVTCTKCGRKFFIDGEGGKEIHCTCPYCGNEMLVALPVIAQPIQPVPSITPSSEPPVQRPIPERKTSNTALKVLITLLVLLLLGGASFFAFTQWQQQQALEQQQLEARRKAHADSLLQIRQAQERAEEMEMRKQEQQQRVSRFLVDFYSKAIIPYGDPSYYDKYLTINCKQLLEEVGYQTCDSNTWDIWWAVFGLRNELPSEEELIRNLVVTPIDDKWYKVRLSQGGQTEFRQIKVIINQGQVLIDNVR